MRLPALAITRLVAEHWNHTIKIVADSSGEIAESNELDNEYTKTITVVANSVQVTGADESDRSYIYSRRHFIQHGQTFSWTPDLVTLFRRLRRKAERRHSIRVERWSDAGAISHPLAPTTATTYTANFTTQFMLTMMEGRWAVSGDCIFHSGQSIKSPPRRTAVSR